MMAEQALSTLGVRSEVRRDGTLHLSLQSTTLNDPRPDEVVVEMVAAPLHPADISMLLGPAYLASGAISGKGKDRTAVFQVPPERMGSLATRTGKSLPVGNEGAGIVVAAGEYHQDLIGKPVAVMGGGMVTRYRVVPVRNLLPIPDGVPVENGAAVLINPLTALAMIETMRERGHNALVHTAAASSLGQMLNRICLQDDIPLVNVVRRSEQVLLLENQGARYVCDSSSSSFTDGLSAHVAAAGATLAFDAVGGGKLAGQILSAMEAHCLAQVSEYNRYGSKVHKQVYFYGGLDTRPSELDRSYGMSWSVGGWLIFDELERMKVERLDALRSRISAQMQSTFACEFAGELSMTELLDPDILRVIAQRSTGAKYLVNPTRPLT
jgi:NADPH2:quinone reductase